MLDHPKIYNWDDGWNLTPSSADDPSWETTAVRPRGFARLLFSAYFNVFHGVFWCVVVYFMISYISFLIESISPPARWGLLDFIRVVLLLLLLPPPPPRPPPLLPPLPPLPRPLLPCQLLAKLFANFGAQCALLDLNLGPSQLSAHRWTSTWDLPSSVRTAGPEPGTCRAQCAPLDLNLGPSELSAHRWTSKTR